MSKVVQRLALALVFGALVRPGQGAPWKHASVPGFEIYSDVDDSALRGLLDDFLLVHRDFQAVWPTPQMNNARPGVIIFCGRPSEFYLLNPQINPQVSPTRNTYVNAEEPKLMINFNLPALPRWRGTDPVTGAMRDVYPGIDDILQGYYASYFQRMMGERVPPWLNQGLAKVIRGMCCAEGSLEFPALTTDKTLATRKATQGSEESLQAAIRAGNFLTLEQLFATTNPAIQHFGMRFGAKTILLWDATEAPEMGLPADPPLMTIPLDGSHKPFWATLPFGTFVDESYEFTQFCLFGEHGKYRAAFIRFAQAASNGPLDEAGFEALFGMDYHAMLLALWRYTDIGTDQIVRVEASNRGPVPPIVPARFSPASRAESDAILAKWSEELAGQPPDSRLP